MQWLFTAQYLSLVWDKSISCPGSGRTVGREGEHVSSMSGKLLSRPAYRRDSLDQWDRPRYSLNKVSWSWDVVQACLKQSGVCLCGVQCLWLIRSKAHLLLPAFPVSRSTWLTGTAPFFSSLTVLMTSLCDWHEDLSPGRAGEIQYC